MKISNNGVELIKSFEGLELDAYVCAAGVLTIGYGHTGGVKAGDRITEDEAEALLRKDLRRFERAVEAQIEVPLDQSQFDALVSFTFNLGPHALKQSTLRRKLNQGDYSGAAEEFQRWVYAGGKRLKGLERRRKAESDLFKASL
jgi:lysozyme